MISVWFKALRLCNQWLRFNLYSHIYIDERRQLLFILQECYWFFTNWTLLMLLNKLISQSIPWSLQLFRPLKKFNWNDCIPVYRLQSLFFFFCRIYTYVFKQIYKITFTSWIYSNYLSMCALNFVDYLWFLSMYFTIFVSFRSCMFTDTIGII